MTNAWTRWAGTLLLSGLIACSGSADRCKSVVCAAGQTCDAATGQCAGTSTGGGSVGGGSVGGGAGGTGGGGAIGGGTGGGGGGLPDAGDDTCAQTCAGCCLNGSCVSGQFDPACGILGSACVACPGSSHCSGVGTCVDTHCAGCLDATGTCITTQSDAQCGRLGGFCNDCATQGGTCDTGSGACTGGTCAGCFNLSGVCEAGNTRGACGIHGSACSLCGAGQICQSGACVGGTGGGAGGGGGGSGGGDGGIDAGPILPGNVFCNTATDFPLTNGVSVDGGMLYTMTIDLTQATDKWSEICANLEDDDGNVLAHEIGPDQVWRLQVTERSDIEWTVQAHPGTTPVSDSIAAIATSPCATPNYPNGLNYYEDALEPFACHNSRTDPTAVEKISLVEVLPQELYLIADNYCATFGCEMGESQRVGLQDVSLFVRPRPYAQPNDSCLYPQPLFVDGGTHESISGSNQLAESNEQGSCFDSTGPNPFQDPPDVVYRFSLTAPQRVTATMQGVGGAMLFITDASCDGGLVTGQERGCSESVNDHEGTTLSIDALPAGDYFLLAADPRVESGTPFELSVDLDAPRVSTGLDSCATASPIALQAGPLDSLTASLIDTTVDGGNGHDSVCGSNTSNGAPDLAYTVQTPADDGGVLRVDVRSLDYDRLTPLLVVESSCGSDAGSVCSNGSAGTIDLENPLSHVVTLIDALPSTAYTVWVDSPAAAGTAHASGPFRLSVDYAPAPSNDLCANAIDLFANSSVGGTTLGAHDDRSHYAALGDSLLGPEIFYRFVPTVSGTATVTVFPQDPYEPALIRLAGCDPGLDVVDYSFPLVGYHDPVLITIPNAVAQTEYFFAVESNSSALTDATGRGGFIIEVSQ